MRQTSLHPPQLSPSLIPLLRLAGYLLQPTLCTDCYVQWPQWATEAMPAAATSRCVFHHQHTIHHQRVIYHQQGSALCPTPFPTLQMLCHPYPNTQVSLKLPSALLVQLLIDPVNWTPHAQACPTSPVQRWPPTRPQPTSCWSHQPAGCAILSAGYATLARIFAGINFVVISA